MQAVINNPKSQRRPEPPIGSGFAMRWGSERRFAYAFSETERLFAAYGRCCIYATGGRASRGAVGAGVGAAQIQNRIQNKFRTKPEKCRMRRNFERLKALGLPTNKLKYPIFQQRVSNGIQEVSGSNTRI